MRLRWDETITRLSYRFNFLAIRVGLINDVPTVKELIDRTMADAENIIRQRLTGFLDGTVSKTAARAVA